jgi:hypothetical protein
MIGRDEAVAHMTAAIERRERTVIFPWKVRMLGRLLTWMPEDWLHRLAPPARPAEE